jgi:hypothetical protein
VDISVSGASGVKYKLARGEKGTCLVIAGSVDQARTVFNYVAGFLQAAPTLAREVANVTRHEIELKNGVTIAVHSNSFRTVRGRTLIGGVFDECLVAGTLVATEIGPRPIESIGVGERVWTRRGLRPVFALARLAIRQSCGA